MSGRYGRTELYLSRFPVRQQISIDGACALCETAYAMEMVGLLAGQPVVQLSQLYQAYGFNRQAGNGICAEHLWPASLSFGPNTWYAGVSDYAQQQRILQVQPDAICYADAANHKLLEMVPLFPGTKAEFMDAIDRGYAMAVFVPPEHGICLWDYQDDGMLGLDSLSASPTPRFIPWAECIGRISYVVTRVSFTGSVTPHRINPYAPNCNQAVLWAMRQQLAAFPDPAGANAFLARINSIIQVTGTDITDLYNLLNTMSAPASNVGSLSAKVNALVPDVIVIPPINPTGGAVNLPFLQDLVNRANALIAAGGVLNAADKTALASDVTSLVPAGQTDGTPLTAPDGAVWTFAATGHWSPNPDRDILRNGVQFAQGGGVFATVDQGLVKVHNSPGLGGHWFAASYAPDRWTQTTPPA